MSYQNPNEYICGDRLCLVSLKEPCVLYDTLSKLTVEKENSKNFIISNFFESFEVGDRSCVNGQRTFAPIILLCLPGCTFKSSLTFVFRWGDCRRVHKTERGPGGNVPRPHTPQYCLPVL